MRDRNVRTTTDPGPQPRLPDFFIVGQPKSGTTALYEMLRQHRSIFMPEKKEPSFYCSDLLAPDHRWRAPTREAYTALFAPAQAHQIAGEASPTYIWAPLAAARIAADRPDAKIIVLLRDPATFLTSLHGELVRREIETEPDLRRALALEPARRAGRAIPPRAARPAALLYSDRVRYAEHLGRYFDVFPREQVAVVVYEDFRADNAATLKAIFSFLEVDTGFTPETSQANPSVRLRAPFARRALRWATRGDGGIARTGRGVVGVLTPRSARHAAVDAIVSRVVYGRPEPLLDLERELRARFAPEVEAVGRLLDRDLATRWSEVSAERRPHRR